MCLFAASCTFCCDLKKRKDTLAIQEELCLFHHLHVSTLCYGVGESKHSDGSKKERKLYVRKLERFVSALRNSNGGAILIHIEGLASDDKYLDFYNELVDDKLYDMIDDGELFDKVYKKSWFEDQHGVILLVVRPTSLLSTLNFYTKLSLDNSIKDPLSNTVFRFLRNRKEFTNQPPTVRGLDNIQEGRGIQFKSIEFTPPDVLKSAVQFSDYVWHHLRLKEYISAFSKVEGGGSFYAGISETPKCYKSENYTSKKYAHVGLREHWVKSETEQSAFKDSIFTKLSAETVILQFSGQKIETPTSTINLQFYDTGHTGYVLEVAVAAVNGILFYDKEGPESYELIDGNTISRLSPKEWFARLQEAWDEEHQTSKYVGQNTEVT